MQLNRSIVTRVVVLISLMASLTVLSTRLQADTGSYGRVSVRLPFTNDRGFGLIKPFNLSHARRVSENGGFPMLRSTRSVTAPLANFLVTNLNDSGVGSLRQAIADANANPGADVITFNVTGTITLTTGQLPISDTLTINGPGTTSLTISGNNASRVFEIAFTIVTISNLTISNAKLGDSDFGGAISNGNSTLTVTNCILSGNTADEGGAITNGGGMVTINNSTLSGNTAGVGIAGFGGGIYNFFGTVIINNSTLSDNSITAGVFGAGGGIYNAGGTLTITNSTLSGNSTGLASGAGGGIYSNGGTMTLVNSTLSNNSANVGGGIISDGTLTITNSTISNNSANIGGGIGNGGITNIKNSIVANSPSGGNCYNTGTFNASGVNFSTDATTPSFTQVPSTGAGGLNLGPLQNNGGPTQTHALLSGSVAIDAVTDCTGVDGNPVTIDQRGVSRPLDGDGDGVSRCDTGAFEAPVLFDLCIQDDSNGYILKINSTTGDYQFTTCSGYTLGGKGSLIVKGSLITLQHNTSDRRVMASIDTSANRATASLQMLSQGRTFSITDRNILNNACVCN
jgi:hypothetical protein